MRRLTQLELCTSGPNNGVLGTTDIEVLDRNTAITNKKIKLLSPHPPHHLVLILQRYGKVTAKLTGHAFQRTEYGGVRIRGWEHADRSMQSFPSLAACSSPR